MLRAIILTGILSLTAACAEVEQSSLDGPHIASLTDLAVESLRSRSYASTIEILEARANAASHSYLAAYDSENLRVYARIDLPLSAPPDDGYPIVVFIHGWLGIDGAPDLDFYYGDDNNYGEMIDAYAAAGFAVFTPGWRGHGTVNGIPAEGIEYMQAWDNGSYLSPVFYAIDVLNLVGGLDTFPTARLNLDRINLSSHSQGGDVALIVLAVSGEGSRAGTDIHAASIWSGTFPARFTQLETYWPMQSAPEAFMAGDGTWNGTAIGANGRVNGRFVFGYPADWITTPNRAEWTWQKDTWNVASVPQAIEVKLEQMYDAINTHVADINDAEYGVAVGDSDAYQVLHDARVESAMANIGGFNAEQFLTEALALQHSDRDFYSFPEWNANLCNRVNAGGGSCFDFEYPGTTHSLRVSEHRWFSPEGTRAGFEKALERDIALFNGQDPARL